MQKVVSCAPNNVHDCISFLEPTPNKATCVGLYIEERKDWDVHFWEDYEEGAVCEHPWGHACTVHHWCFSQRAWIYARWPETHLDTLPIGWRTIPSITGGRPQLSHQISILLRTSGISSKSSFIGKLSWQLRTNWRNKRILENCRCS